MPLHGKLRGMYDLTRLAIYMKARNAFPSRIPIMDGSGYPPATRAFIVKSLDQAKNWIRDEARKAPLKMFLMTPDPHGSGKKYELKNDLIYSGKTSLKLNLGI